VKYLFDGFEFDSLSEIYRKGFIDGNRKRLSNENKVLEYMKGYELKNGVSPTLQEIRIFLNLKSLTSVQRALDVLAKMDLVIKANNQRRGWRVK
jgi:hypothetical protein